MIEFYGSFQCFGCRRLEEDSLVICQNILNLVAIDLKLEIRLNHFITIWLNQSIIYINQSTYTFTLLKFNSSFQKSFLCHRILMEGNNQLWVHYDLSLKSFQIDAPNQGCEKIFNKILFKEDCFCEDFFKELIFKKKSLRRWSKIRFW